MKHSLRRLIKSPAFALTAILTVGAAIGANALIFSVVNGIILKPLPYAQPESLVGAWLVAPGVMAEPLNQSAATYSMLRDSAQSFQDIGLWSNGSATILEVACANVANLFLVRAEGRQQELAVRLALGAESRRIAWELLSESLLVALGGGALGVALSYGGIQLLVYLQPAQLPRLNEITLDPIVLAFTLALSVVAGLLFGAIPIAKYARPHLASALKDSSRGSSEGRERHRARNGFVVAQVALAAILLVASGLMVRTFLAIRDVPPGFSAPEDVLTLRISVPSAVVSDAAQVARLHEQIAHSIETVSGVASVGLTSSLPMDGNNNDPIWVEDFPRHRRADPDTAPAQVPGPALHRDHGEPPGRRPHPHLDRRAREGAGGAGQREPGARVLG